MSTDMKIRVSQMEGRIPVTVFHINGQIDASTQSALQEKATEAYENGMRDLLLDITDVTYMASAGFRVIHSISKMLDSDDEDVRHLKLLNPSDDVSRIIKTLGFDHYVSSYADLKEAVASF